jgi:exodeoxyribonuclease V alpha subunit
VPAARLTHIHRQAAESQIVQAAHQVNAGRMPSFVTPRDATGRDSDFHVIEREDPAEVVATIADLVAERIPQGLGIAAAEVQVLSPRHRGDAGTQALNRALQARLNPDGAQLTGASGNLRVGDKVMQLRNDYEKEVFNGDVGWVAMASEQRLTVMFDGRPVNYELREADDLQLAYACSVHKAQGSEYPAVVLALLTQHHPMLQRNLVYTALTRGRRLVVIVGSRRALRAAVQRGERAIRFSLLAQRVRAALESSA